MTLPDRVLRLLGAVDADRSRAIAKLTDMVLGEAGTNRKLVELVPVSRTKAVIIVAHSRYLGSVTWLRLVEVAPARYLLSLLPGTSIEKLEVTIGDLLDVVPESEPEERRLLDTLHKCLRAPRRDQTVTKEEIIFVELPP